MKKPAPNSPPTAVIVNDHMTITYSPARGGIMTGFQVNSRRSPGVVREIVQTPGRPADPKRRGMFLAAPWCGRFPKAVADASKIPGIKRKLNLVHAADPKTCLHGIARQLPFEVVERSTGRLHMRQVFANDSADYNWFGPYRLDQICRITGERELESTVRLENTGKGPIPATICEHPMFPRQDGMKFRFNAKKILRVDKDTLVPTGEPEVIPAELMFAEPTIPPGDLEVMYIGWDGRAEIIYDDYDVVIRDRTPNVLTRCLMAWHLATQSVCALESQTGEAFGVNRLNAKQWTGTRILRPGEVLELQTTYLVHPRF